LASSSTSFESGAAPEKIPLKEDRLNLSTMGCLRKTNLSEKFGKKRIKLTGMINLCEANDNGRNNVSKGHLVILANP